MVLFIDKLSSILFLVLNIWDMSWTFELRFTKLDLRFTFYVEIIGWTIISR